MRVVSPILTIAVPFFWVQPTLSEWMLPSTLGYLGLCAHFVMAKSYGYASSVDLAPLGYLQIIFAVVYGVVLFGTTPSPWSIAGMGLIFASGLMIYTKRPRAVLPKS